MKKYLISLLLLLIISLGSTFLTFIVCKFLGLNKFMTGYVCGLSVMWLFKLLKI